MGRIGIDPVTQATKKLAAARRKHSPSRHGVTEWPVRKDAVAFFVGGDGPAAAEEASKIITFKHT